MMDGSCISKQIMAFMGEENDIKETLIYSAFF